MRAILLRKIVRGKPDINVGLELFSSSSTTYFLFLRSEAFLHLRGHGVLFSLMGFPLRRESKLYINNN